MTDFYEANADIYAAVSLSSLSGQLEALREVVQEPINGSLIEIGAGVGSALSTLASMTTDSLYAIEPSKYMRVGLMTTVANDETLRKRVTILPGTLEQVAEQLPASLGGIVTFNALGHFKATELEAFWRFAADRLTPGGQLVLGLQPPFEPIEIPWTDFGEAHIGNRTYRTAGTASITSDDIARWTVRWTIHDEAGAELERREASTQWTVVGPRHVTDAATAVGLTLAKKNSDGTVLCFQKPN